MLKQLEELIKGIDLVWCDNPGKKIQESENYQKLMKLVPNLRKIHQRGLHDTFEFNRTMRHVFRTLKIYYLLKEGTLTYSTLSNQTLQKIRDKFLVFNEFYLPIILIYHDIGRFVDRKTHAQQSSALIHKHNLLEDFTLSKTEKLLLRKVIEYHLLIATIYTGESTFFGVISLINDKEFLEILSQKDKAKLFINILEAFTYLDVLGYPYSTMYNHYLNYYQTISNKLKDLLGLWPNREQVTQQAKKNALQWTDWRLAGALRIYQFIKTKPHLTADFYFTALKDSIRTECDKHMQKFDWDDFKTTYLASNYQFQIKYALAFLLILAFGEFKRIRLKKNQKISSNLLLFWMALSKEMKKRGFIKDQKIFNIYFEKLPFWSEITKEFLSKLNIHALKSVINRMKIVFDERKQEYNCFLDFSQL